MDNKIKRQLEGFLCKALRADWEEAIVWAEEQLDAYDREEQDFRREGWEEKWRRDLRQVRPEELQYYFEQASAEERRQARMYFLQGELRRIKREYDRVKAEGAERLEMEKWLAEKMGWESDLAAVKRNYGNRLSDLLRRNRSAYLELGGLRGDLERLRRGGKGPQWDLEALRNVRVESLLTEKVFSAGNGRFRSLCPFHTEKTGSFFVFADNTWHCFGCQAHGHGAIDFIMRRDNCGFKEAVGALKDFYA